MPPAHAACLAMLEPVMTMNEGARHLRARRPLLGTGDVLRQPGLVRALELVADEGARAVYDGTLAERLLGLMRRARRARHRATTSPRTRRAGRSRFESPTREPRSLTRGGLAASRETLGARCRACAALDAAERALALVDALAATASRPRRTRRTSTVVDADGNACVLTTSLGLGSGDWLPGLDLHLNSMLGEADLLVGPLEPGERMRA